MIETLRHTAFICGRLTSAGETGCRARCGCRGDLRTCIRVAWEARVVVKERLGEVVVGLRGAVVVVVGRKREGRRKGRRRRG